MAQQLHKLTDRKVKALSEPKRYNDGGGLYLQISKSGGKSWLFRYQKTNMGLGPYPTVTLAKARERAEECRRNIADGKNPQHVRAAQTSGAHTFRQCAERYIEMNEKTWVNAKHRQQWRNTLSTYAYPIIGDINVADIETAHMLEVLEPIWHTKNPTATRVRERMDTVLNSAKTLGLFEGQNPAQWKGHLEHTLPNPSKVRKVKHRPALPYSEMGEFMRKLRSRQSFSSLLLEFQILTATRPSEPRLVPWEEIDGDAWTLPLHRTKTKERDHRIPLSLQAQSVLSTMRELGTDGLVFPGAKEGRPMSDATVQKQMKLMGVPNTVAVPHGFRSTFKDWTSEETEYHNTVSEMALGHTIKNASEAAYRRGDLFEKRRALMQDWADYCDKIIS